MAAGLSVSCLFLVLGVRELRHPARAIAILPDAIRPVAPPTAIALAASTRAIAIGETITADLVLTRVGNPALNATAATPAEVVGKVATQPIAAGALIQRTMIDNGTKLAIRVPVGMRAMSIDTTAEIAVAGLIRPGDRVDVQVIYPGEDAVNGQRGVGRSRAETLLQMVPVLAIGELVLGDKPVANNDQASVQAPAASPARTVTVLLTPEQVSTLSLAKSVGTLYLSLRNPTDQALEVVVAKGPPPLARPAMAPLAARLPSASIATRSGPAPGRHAIQLVVDGRSETIQSGSGGK
ncbi:MAG: pilus assembly protein CpaB [Sphingomonadales bacterium]|nr:pilus assembly protein CpaB [Sphingomonadales bacterium]